MSKSDFVDINEVWAGISEQTKGTVVHKINERLAMAEEFYLTFYFVHKQIKRKRRVADGGNEKTRMITSTW